MVQESQILLMFIHSSHIWFSYISIYKLILFNLCPGPTREYNGRSNILRFGAGIGIDVVVAFVLLALLAYGCYRRGSQWGCSKHGTRLKFWMFHATRLPPLRPSTNNTVIWTKIIHDTRLIFSLFHDTRLIFWMFHATRLTPLRPS